MTATKSQPPPKHLSATARRFWTDVLSDYTLEPHHLAVLTVACEAMDRAAEARAAIARDGDYVEGRFGLKAHPGLAIERDARTQILRAVRELGLDLEQPTTPGPPSRWKG